MIDLTGVVKRYKQGDVTTDALRGVDAHIPKQSFLIVLGPSGSGKSTLLNLMGALDLPTEGSVSVNEAIISEMGSKARSQFRRKHVGFVFQDYNVLNTLSVKENIELGQYLSTRPMSIDEALRAVGLSGYEGRYPYELSGGERQRLSIARAIVKRPDILFCDEPTGSLDETLAKDVLGVIHSLNETYGTTVILITHNEALRHIGSHVMRLKSGHIDSFTKNHEPIAIKDITF